ncbi:unnamed protein product, partial [Mesorhabditis belari]|uniref:RanBP2-type domain-containing protein n=1 Tax=Mesorhabditis belari TaxID=2138241 RepID=A0AAF3ESS5_9BILA
MPSSSNSPHSPSPIPSCSNNKQRPLSMFSGFRRARRDNVFVLPTQYSHVVAGSGMDYVRSVSNSAFYDSSFPTLPPRTERKTSEPAEMTHSGTSLLMSGPSSSSQYQQQLNIDTFGGETAGSGLEYITTMLADEDETCNRSIRLAQQLALSEMRQDLERQRKEISQMEADQVMLEVMLRDDLADLGQVDETKLDQEIAKLEEEIDEIRRTHPHCVPPPVPLRPRRSTPDDEAWRCMNATCGAANHVELYKCIKCGLPRLIISDEERKRCSCQRCRLGLDRLSMTPAVEDNDWMLVNSP